MFSRAYTCGDSDIETLLEYQTYHQDKIFLLHSLNKQKQLKFVINAINVCFTAVHIKWTRFEMHPHIWTVLIAMWMVFGA